VAVLFEGSRAGGSEIMKKPGRLWIDITDMSTWSGHLTGTQRVVYEIGRRLGAENGQDVGFFIYNDKTHTFNEASFQPILDKIQQSQVPPKQEVSAPVASQASFVGSLKHAAVRSYQRLPHHVRSKIKDEHKRFVKKAYRKLLDLKNARAHRQALLQTTIGSNPGPLQFVAEDSVLILGKPWDTMSLIDSLAKQKRQQNFKLIHLIYDMIPTYLPHVFGKPLPQDYTHYMFEALSITDLALAISVSTKKDVARFCKDQLLPTPTTEVVHLGDSFMPNEQSGASVKNLEGKDFILCVGTVEIRKNHILLYTAFREMLQRGQKVPHLVIVGGTGWYVNDVLYELENDPLLKDKIIRPKGTSDQELAWLYQNCLFTIYPSVYEGWGLPIAESLYYGKACIASNASSMPEVGGDLVEYFSPYDSGSCASLITKYLDPAVRKAQEAKIAKHYRYVSWDNTATQVRSLLDKYSS
jgi:hypothetical protein